jgi:putative membrane protein
MTGSPRKARYFEEPRPGMNAAYEQRAEPPEDPRVPLAAERTLLAWVRTGLALMGFGFVVARFGLFLHEIAAARGTPAEPSFGLSHWLGATLIVLGVVVNVLAAVRHVRLLGRLRRGEPYRPSAWSLGVVVTGALAFGVVMTVYLFVQRP